VIILGLNIYHGDSSACIFKNGSLIAAVEEERFTRVKHSAGFPINSINFCLKTLNIEINDVDYIAINRNPRLRIVSKLLYFIKNKFKIINIFKRIKNFKKISSIADDIVLRFNLKRNTIKKKILFFDHHLCHAASSVISSNFNNTDYATIDGFGDFVSTTIGEFKNNKFYQLDEVKFPHSIGIFYTTITQFLGFPNYGDEYKVMGLASYGKPIYFDSFLKIINLHKNNIFRLNLKFFKHHTSGIETSWLDSNPNISSIYTSDLCNILGNVRSNNDKILQIHKDIAASAQAIYEYIFFEMLNKLQAKTSNTNLCLSGGCAMNSVANGKIKDNTPYKKIFINHSPADSGGAIGAGLLALRKFEQVIDISSINNPYLGNNYSNLDIKNIINTYKDKLLEEKIKIKFFENKEKNNFFQFIAKEISNKKIIGFFNGRMEFGARAL
jgi:carbamoyltransferase